MHDKFINTKAKIVQKSSFCVEKKGFNFSFYQKKYVNAFSKYNKLCNYSN